MVVTCASCGADQADAARFCSACGSPLQRTCSACGAEAPSEAAFCPSCGASLRVGAARATPTDEHEERRLVTVLFADLAGSTALGERIDPEDLRALQGELFELVNAQIERFGGVSEKFVGDAVLAVFGAPAAHDDDAERAVRAALEIRARFRGFAERARARHGAELGLRIGVNTGEVVAGREAAARGELMVSGDAVNVAARLQQRAEPGQVLVGERTHAASRRAIRYANVGAALAKGKDDAVSAWDALDVVAPPGTRGLEGLSAPIIGRDDELELLRTLAGRVVRERSPQLVTLLGNAGVGKTRLLSEFVAGLADALLLQGRCLPYGGGVTYWPLAEAVKGYAGILDSDPAEAALAKAEAALRPLVPAEQVAGVVEAVAWTIGLQLPERDRTDVRGRLRDAWRRLLHGFGQRQLTVLAIEDVHWASEPLLDLLEELAAALDDTAVLLVCTARPEFLDARRRWGGGLRDSTSIGLGPLPREESTRLVEALLGADGVPADVTARIVSRAEGNPFYVEEILQMLIDRGVLARENGTWSIRGAIDAFELPDTVHGVIAARIDLLDARSREALRRCSVMGRVFWPAAVGVEEDVVGALGRRGLVGEQPDSVMEGMREFAFKHALTQDVAYATLPRPDRRALHRRVGEWVEHVAPGRDAETAELAAHHYTRALEYGETGPELRERAFGLFLTAGEAALARAASSSAERLLSQTLELADDSRRRVIALLALARAQLASARFDLSYARFAEARDLAASLGDRALLGETLSWFSRIAWLTGHWREAIEAANAGVHELAGLPESPELAKALARRSQIEMLRGLPEAEEHAAEAIAVARRVGNEHAELNARANLFTARANRGVVPDESEASAIVERALAIGDVNEAYRAAVNYLWSAQAFLPFGELDRAMTELQELVGRVPPVESLDLYLDRSIATIVDVPAGRWDEVDRVASRRDEPYLQSGGHMLQLELVGGMALRRGQLAEAERALDELRRVALASGEPQRILPMAGVVLPLAALREDAKVLHEVAEAVLTRTDREWATLPATAIPRALAAAGAEELLRRVVAAFREKSTLTPSPRLAISLAVAEGRLSLLERRIPDAIERLQAALEQERRLEWVYRTACLELDLADALEAGGRVADVEAARSRAAAVLEPLGCVNAY